MRVGSLFSGIEGFGLGFEQAGCEIVWQVEKEKFCRQVLARHWPKVKRFSDVRRVGAGNLQLVDCITAGVPCQDVSIAGKREGLAGKRTGLFYHFARILQELRPAWFVFENVPGLFSSNEGRDFAEVLRVLMVECGYGVSWRVLDSRYFKVAQRRERVFIVGRLGEPCPAEILFESSSGGGDLAARGEARADIAVPLTSGSGESRPGRRIEDDFNLVGSLQSHTREHGHAMSTQQAAESGQIVCFDTTQLTSEHNRSNPRPGDPCHPLSATAHAPSVAYALRKDPGGIGQGHNTTFAITENMRNRSQGPANYVAATVNSGGNSGGFRTEPGEHLVSATPDSNGMRTFASLPRGLDSARYRALGNAVTVSVAHWIAKRLIAAHERLTYSG